VGLLGGPTKCVERLVPEAFEVLSDGREASVVNRVDAARPLSPVRDESHVLEDPQVLRHGRSAYRKRSRDLDNGKRSASKALEDRSAGCIAEGVKLRTRLVSCHER
jgi:hypothetical protein